MRTHTHTHRLSAQLCAQTMCVRALSGGRKIRARTPYAEVFTPTSCNMHASSEFACFVCARWMIWVMCLCARARPSPRSSRVSNGIHNRCECFVGDLSASAAAAAVRPCAMANLLFLRFSAQEKKTAELVCRVNQRTRHGRYRSAYAFFSAKTITQTRARTLYIHVYYIHSYISYRYNIYWTRVCVCLCLVCTRATVHI